MGSRKWWVLASGILVLIAAWSLYWYIVTNNLRHGVANWQASLSAQGWRLNAGDGAMGGWPLWASVTLPNATLGHDGPAAPGNVGLAASSVTVSINLLRPDQLRIGFLGPVHLRVGQLPDLIVISDDLVAEAPLRVGPPAARISGQGVRIEVAEGAWHATAKTVSAEGQLDQENPRNASHATFNLTGTALTLPTTIKWALGPDVRTVAISGVVNGPFAAISGSPAIAAAAWRDHGGSIDIARYAIAWGPLDLTGAATLKLDDQLQPAGTGTAHVVGYAQTLDRLAAGGAMTNGAALAAKAILGLLAGSAGSQPGGKQFGEDGGIDVPLVLQYRILSMRQLPLVQIPELDWPAKQ